MNLPLIAKLSIKLVSLFRANSNELVAQTMADRNPDIAKELWTSMMDHMVNGKDMSDYKSAGGWNEQELNTFCSLCNSVDA